MKENNKRVLIITNDLSYPAGALIFAAEVIKALYKANCELFIWTNHYPDVELGDNRISKIQWLESTDFFKHGHGITGKLKRIKEDLRFLTTIRDIRPNACLVIADRPRVVYKIAELWTKVILYLHEISMTCPGDPGFRFLRKSKTICTRKAGLSCLIVDKNEGCLGRRPTWRKVQRILRTLITIKVLRSMKYLVANSSYTAKTVAQDSSLCRPEVVNPIIIFKEIAPNIDERSPEGRFRIAYIGRLEEGKGIFEALHILAMLPEYYKLIIVGHGSEEKNAKELAEKLGIVHRVKFMGWLSREETSKEIASSGVVLIPSLCAEGFAMIGLESLYFGTPVVAYNTGGIIEWCEGNFSKCVPVGDKESAKQAILSVTANFDIWKDLSLGARKYVLNHFMPEKNFNKLLSVVENTIYRKII